jgi:hypothetical protein
MLDYHGLISTRDFLGKKIFQTRRNKRNFQRRAAVLRIKSDFSNCCSKALPEAALLGPTWEGQGEP